MWGQYRFAIDAAQAVQLDNCSTRFRHRADLNEALPLVLLAAGRQHLDEVQLKYAQDGFLIHGQ